MPNLMDTELGWYCFKALPKKEHLAAQLLLQHPDIGTFCPRIAYNKNTRRGKVRFIECVFPGYVFIHANLKEQYRLIRATHGIRDLVFFGDRVVPVPEAFLEELREHLQETGEAVKEIPDTVLKPGMEVTIADGPLRDFSGIVAREIDARKRVALLLDFLGRQLEIRIPEAKLIAREELPRQGLFH